MQKNIKNYTLKQNNNYLKHPVITIVIRLFGKENTLSQNNKDKPQNRLFKKLRKNSNKHFFIYKNIEKMIKKNSNPVITFQLLKLRKDIKLNSMKKKKLINYLLANKKIKQKTLKKKSKLITKKLIVKTQGIYNNQKGFKKK